jgi:thioredoxin-like negative regulator of GroEL
MKKETFLILIIFIIPLVLYFYLSHTNNSNISISGISKPKIIKFSSNLCGECKRLDENLKTLYPKYQNNIELISIPVQVENDYNREMIKQYNVTLVPTTILINKNQKITKRIEGYIDNNELDKYLKELTK